MIVLYVTEKYIFDTLKRTTLYEVRRVIDLLKIAFLDKFPISAYFLLIEKHLSGPQGNPNQCAKVICTLN